MDPAAKSAQPRRGAGLPLFPAPRTQWRRGASHKLAIAPSLTISACQIMECRLNADACGSSGSWCAPEMDLCPRGEKVGLVTPTERPPGTADRSTPALKQGFAGRERRSAWEYSLGSTLYLGTRARRARARRARSSQVPRIDPIALRDAHRTCSVSMKTFRRQRRYASRSKVAPETLMRTSASVSDVGDLFAAHAVGAAVGTSECQRFASVSENSVRDSRMNDAP
jgi:hypothetical protein